MRDDRQFYLALRDTMLKGKVWWSGDLRKLTSEEALPFLRQGKIERTSPPQPKRFVIILDTSGEQILTLTWGEYLKTRRKKKQFNIKQERRKT